MGRADRFAQATLTMAWGTAAPGKAFPPLPPLAPDDVPMNKFTRDVRLVVPCAKARRGLKTDSRRWNCVRILDVRVVVCTDRRAPQNIEDAVISSAEVI